MTPPDAKALERARIGAWLVAVAVLVDAGAGLADSVLWVCVKMDSWSLVFELQRAAGTAALAALVTGTALLASTPRWTRGRGAAIAALVLVAIQAAVYAIEMHSRGTLDEDDRFLFLAFPAVLAGWTACVAVAAHGLARSAGRPCALEPVIALAVCAPVAYFSYAILRLAEIETPDFFSIAVSLFAVASATLLAVTLAQAARAVRLALYPWHARPSV